MRVMYADHCSHQKENHEKKNRHPLHRRFYLDIQCGGVWRARRRKRSRAGRKGSRAGCRGSKAGSKGQGSAARRKGGGAASKGRAAERKGREKEVRARDAESDTPAT